MIKIGAGTHVRPPWMRPVARRPNFALQAVRPADHVILYRLTIVFSGRNPVYGEAFRAGRLKFGITMQGALEVFEQLAEGKKKVLDTVSVRDNGELHRDGQPIIFDGKPVNILTDNRRVPAEAIFRLGEVPPRREKMPDKIMADPWAWPPDLPLRRPRFLANTRAGCTVRLAKEALIDPDRLAVEHDHQKERLTVFVDGKCFGVTADLHSIDYHLPVDLTAEVPALNYGPHYRSLIARTIEENDERELAEIFLYTLSGTRRSFKPIDLYARDFFQTPGYSIPHAVKLTNLWLEAVGGVEKDNWYYPKDINLLLAEGPPFIIEGRPAGDLWQIVQGTMGLAWRIGAFSDRQFAAVALFFNEIGRQQGSTPDQETLDRMRGEHYRRRAG